VTLLLTTLIVYVLVSFFLVREGYLVWGHELDIPAMLTPVPGILTPC
jgi:hypothetical protein